MVLNRPGSLELSQVPDPEPTGDRVVIDVAACAVCRTDLQIVRGDLAMRRTPVIPGHQIVGRLPSGERVGAAWLGGADGTCRYCRSGRENLCPNAEFHGWTLDGGYAEKVAVHADYVFALPSEVSDVAAAPLLCGGIIGYRSLHISGIEPGGRLGLYGFGSSARLAIQVARHWGCEVFVCTRSERERALASELGAAWTGGYGDRPPEELDAAITFAPSGDVVVAALRAVAPGAAVAVNAIHLDRMPEFSYDLLWRERSLRSVANFTRQDAREFLDLAARIPIVTAAKLFDLDDANDALDQLESGELDATAVLRVR